MSPITVMWKEFSVYKVTYRSTPTDIALAQIICAHQGLVKGYITFDKDAASLRQSKIAGGKILLYYTIDKFLDVMNILQNEAPLELAFNTSQNIGWIRTKGYEPVGENE